MNKETIRELRERADGMITATLADSRVRSCVHDIEFDFVRRDSRHDVQDVINLELDRRTAADEMPHVTPDTVVTTTSQSATNDGDDEGENTQTTSADVKPDVDASVVPK